MGLPASSVRGLTYACFSCAYVRACVFVCVCHPQFGNIILGGKDAHREESTGTIKLHGDGIGWKSRKTGSVISISKADLRSAEWIKIPHAYQLKVKQRGGFITKFNGFRSQDKDTVKSYCTTTFGLEVEDASLSYKGWNWGAASVENNCVSFTVEGKQTLEVPLQDIAQATAQKNEAVVEMVDDDTALPEDELLVEVRFHIPSGSAEEAAELDGTAAEAFVDRLKQSGDLEQAGTSLVTLDDMQVQVPRGRYDIEMADKFMKLHGKSNDYKVLYSNIASLYLLPKPDGYHMALSLQLEHPLRQGATTYPHIVLQLPRDAPLEVEIALTEAECTARFGEKLDKFESGDMPSVVAKVLAAFTKRKVMGIKAGGFNAESKDDRTKSIRCSLKAAEGFLFPLDKAFYFLSNKPVLVELERVASVEFNRVDKASSAAGRTFDITLHMKDQSGDMQFVNLQRSDYKELFRFLSAKKVRIKNIAAAGFGDAAGGRDSDDDDPGLERARREGAANVSMAEGDDDDDDSDDESDEDFQAGGESSVDEEYDEGGSSDSEAAGGTPKGKKKKGAKKRKAESGSDDGSGSDSDDEPKKKSKGKKKKAKKESGSDDDSGSGSDSDDAPKKKSKKAAKAAGKSKLEKPKKKRAKKDAAAPKRGQSAYFLWMNAVGRGKAKEVDPSIDIKEVSRRCGQMWKEMDGAAKAEWEEKAKADKARYEREMQEYKAKARADAAEEEEAKPAVSGSDSDSD